MPQLINILKNEMSLIGPRPLLEEYLYKFSEEQKKRHDVLPGITGLAQINESKNDTWKLRLKLDVLYSSKINFILDLKILYKTFKVLVLNKKQFNNYKKLYE